MQNNRQNNNNMSSQQYRPYSGQPMQQNGQYQPYGSGQPVQQNGQYQPYGNGQPVQQKNQYGPYGNVQPKVMPQNSQYPPYNNSQPNAGERAGSGLEAVFPREALEAASRRKPDKKNQDLRLRSLIPGIVGLFLALWAGDLSVTLLSLGIMGSFIMANKDTRPFRKERKFGTALLATISGMTALASVICLAVPSISRIVGGGAAVLIGLMAVFGPMIATHLKKKRCTEAVRAVCIDHDSHMSRGRGYRTMVYACIWQYTIGGRAYTACDSVYSCPKQFEVGEGTELMVNPADPSDFLRESDPTNIVFTVIGVIIAIAGLLSFLF